MAHPNSLKNLKRGGPGRPRGAGLAAKVRSLVGDDGKQLVEGWHVLAFGSAKQRQKFFGESVRVSAKDRSAAMDALADRGFGRAPQILDTEDGSPIGPVNFVIRWRGENSPEPTR